VQASFLAGARMEKTCRDEKFEGYYITSAKDGDNINAVMIDLLEKVRSTCNTSTIYRPA
jgi:hypothetical protein